MKSSVLFQKFFSVSCPPLVGISSVRKAACSQAVLAVILERTNTSRSLDAHECERKPIKDSGSVNRETHDDAFQAVDNELNDG